MESRIETKRLVSPKIEMKSIIGITILLAVFLAGCATTHYDNAQTHLERGEYDAAIVSLKMALQESPQDIQLLRDLGIAYYKKGMYDESLERMRQVLAQNPQNNKATLYAGLIYEEKRLYDEAISAYQNYIKIGRVNSIRKQIDSRLKLLTVQKIAQSTRRTLANEKNIDVDAIPANTVAVAYFKSLSGEAALVPLQKGLTDMLIVDLSKVKNLRLVEQVRLQQLLEEMNLSANRLDEPKTTVRIGRLLGATSIITGAFAGLAGDRLRLDAVFLDVKTGKIAGSHYVAGELSKFFALEKQLVFAILEEMGVELTEGEQSSIQNIPTESLVAFLAYSRGLDYSDRGYYDEAAKYFQQAVIEDPHFEAARRKLADAQGRYRATNQTPRDLESTIKASERIVLTQAQRNATACVKLSKNFMVPPHTADAMLIDGDEILTRSANADVSTNIPVSFVISWEP